MIEIKNLCKTYVSKKSSNTVALDDVSFCLPNNGLVFILGKSGCGKSTLLNLLGGLDTVSSGNIIVDGKDITKFDSKQYDSYRNSTIGIVFQEFNLFDELTVKENISIALELQNKKVSDKEINNLLRSLGLEGLESRKLNELSGGQKQRVAIGRALIKKPRILLCDEPTGNLDSKSSKQIFDILKEISNDILVVIVSHDGESAKKYNDYIIRLKDGKIESNSITEIDKSNETLTFVNSKLPFKYIQRIGIRGVFHHPLRLFMTVLITSLSLVFLGIALNFALFDQKMFVVDTMKAADKYNIVLAKSKNVDGFFSIEDFEEKDFDYIKKVIDDDQLNYGYFLYDAENGDYFKFNFDDLNFRTQMREESGKMMERHYYYRDSLDDIQFIELVDDDFVGDIIGKIPSKDNELLIHKYMAEYIIKFGIYDYNGNLYKPSSIQQLLDDNVEFRVGDYKVVITGVVDDINEWESYVEDEIVIGENEYASFNENYSNLGNYIYVKGFANNYKASFNFDHLVNTMYMVEETFSLDESGDYSYNYDLEFEENWNLLSSNIDYLSKNGISSINSLAKDQVIVSFKVLQLLYPDIKNQIYEYAQENKDLTFAQIQQEALIEFLNSNDNLDSLFYGGVISDKAFDVSIVGISLDDNCYASTLLTSDYSVIDKENAQIFVHADSFSQLTEFIQDFDFRDERLPDGEYLIFIPPYEGDISFLFYLYNTLNIIASIVTLVFTLFALLVFTNFISVTVSYSRKKIGVLKALGASGNDVLGIFAYESFITGMISVLFAVILLIFVTGIINSVLMSYLEVLIDVIYISNFTFIAMLAYTLILSFVITLISISYVTKVKPIDSILEK